MSSLLYDMIVSTPIGSRVLTSCVCLDCPIQIESHHFVIDLICLPLHEIDIILGMN